MIRYRVTDADRAPLPDSYRREPRYLGYGAAEADRPFARYFQVSTRPIQDHVRDALLAGPAPSEHGYAASEVPHRLSRPGYEALETGWTRGPRGTVMVSVLTDMPGVRADMWDWWFGWHSTDTARYKLWHPDAHRYAAIGDDRSADRALTDRQRYVGNVSYVDEYLGGRLQRLAIRFVDPATLGFDDRPGWTHVCARTTLSDLPLAAGWLVHQVRPTEHGAEMRSRFFLNDPEILDLPAHSLPASPATRVLGSAPGRAALTPLLPRIGARMMGPRIGYDLVHHCAAEMNHLASFLPALHEEFGATP